VPANPAQPSLPAYCETGRPVLRRICGLACWQQLRPTPCLFDFSGSPSLECEEQVGINALAKRSYVEAVPGEMPAARRSGNPIERNQWRAASTRLSWGNLGKDPEIRTAQDGQVEELQHVPNSGLR